MIQDSHIAGSGSHPFDATQAHITWWLSLFMAFPWLESELVRATTGINAVVSAGKQLGG